MTIPSFPIQHARTRRFTLGRPRAVRVAPDGGHALFLRSGSGQDPVTDLWRLDVDDMSERRLVDARSLVADDADLPVEERARRERARETAGGVVAYAADRSLRRVVFTLAGRLFRVDVDDGEPVELSTVGPAFDPRPDRDGTRVAYTSGGGLHVIDADGTSPRTVVAEEGVTWGLAEFVAAEEMDRDRGFWWSPDGRRIAAARVDESDVPLWHVADPASPWTAPTPQRYPVAGAVNARVTLAVLDPDGAASPVEIDWDRERFEYLADVVWGPAGPLTLLVVSRDQRTRQVLTADPDTGATTVVRTDTDPAWLELVGGVPVWLDDRRLLVAVDLDDGRGGHRALVVDDEALTPPGLQVRSVLDARPDGIWFTGSWDPRDVGVFHLDPDSAHLTEITDRPGLHTAAVGGDTVVIGSAGLDDTATRTTVHPGGRRRGELVSHAETPVVTPNVELLELGERRLHAALLRPSDDDGRRLLPVLLDPYGGPHLQRVVNAAGAYLTSQWFADQGFAVLVVDGRGTPGRGPAWERAIRDDLATPVLDDQVAALEAAAVHEPRLDLGRVAIRGWSFGGYLAALAVLRRPDVFHAAIAGAPVTDWRLYDTFYTERYLGHPDTAPGAYRRSSLVDASGELVDASPVPDGAAAPRLLLVHGLADDNVVAAHSLRLSSALLAAGRAHRFLPLSGVTHMTPQEVVAENLLRIQVAFLHEALGS